MIGTRGNWHRKPRLKLWLRLMAYCEDHGLGDSALYAWFARRAMGCNAWRSTWRRS